MNRNIVQSAILVIVSMMSFSVYAKNNFKNTCMADTTKSDISSNSCFQYISGFIGGALTTDVAIINELKKDSATSSFIDRVFRTRAPVESRYSQATYFAKFCFPADATKENLAKDIMTKMPKNDITNDSLDALIYSTLKSEYPCK